MQAMGGSPASLAVHNPKGAPRKGRPWFEARCFVYTAHATLAYVQLLGRYFVGTVPLQAHVTEAAFRVGVMVTVLVATEELEAATIVTVITPFALIPVTLAYLPVGKSGVVGAGAGRGPGGGRRAGAGAGTPAAGAN